ncbi:hypothetical protein SAMN02745166_01097 [Prosthecobacter debontii]|uniref:Uncharacterized protein n=2 Tax=Prosthecobacter debontii TaxID=48467 RepID=A0A1T4X894_9BACT|nr:hypothetical protein SAMN02745166_01097 [Prosthecobacter debontii]
MPAKKGVKIEVLRKPSDNPSVDPVALLSLLWKEELLSLIAQKLQNPKTCGVNKRKLAEIAAAHFTLPELKSYVRETLKFREQWRNDPQPG